MKNKKNYPDQQPKREKKRKESHQSGGRRSYLHKKKRELSSRGTTNKVRISRGDAHNFKTGRQVLEGHGPPTHLERKRPEGPNKKVQKRETLSCSKRKQNPKGMP